VISARTAQSDILQSTTSEPTDRHTTSSVNHRNWTSDSKHQLNFYSVAQLFETSDILEFRESYTTAEPTLDQNLPFLQWHMSVSH